MRRRDLLAIGGSVFGGSAVLGTGAVSRSEFKRDADIAVAGDPDAYLGISPGKGEQITDELTEQFQTGSPEKDLIVEATNRVGVDLQDFAIDKKEVKNAIIPTTSLVKSDFGIDTGSSETVKADVTCIRTDPTITYDVSVGSDGDADNDVSIDATRTRSINCETGIAARDAAPVGSSDRHVIREFPGFSSAASPGTIVITYPDDFDIKQNTVTVRIGSSTADITIDSGNLNSKNNNSNKNELTIDLSSRGLNDINDVRVLQVNYDIINGDLSGNVSVSLNSKSIFTNESITTTP